MKNITTIFAAFALLFLFSCQDGNTDAIESGTYQGSVKKVVPEKTEIYVETDDNKTLELYFRETTALTRNGESVNFDQLQEGSRVEVQVEKDGEHLNPIAVRMLD